MKTSLYVILFFVIFRQISLAQREINIYRDLIPATLLTDAEHTKQITEVLRAKGSIDPLILWEYIEYLQALGNGASTERINTKRAAALDAEVKARARRSEWLHHQRQMIDSMQSDEDLKQVIRLLFLDEYSLHLLDSAGQGEMEDSYRRYYIALRWINGNDSVFFDPDNDYSSQYREKKRERRTALTAAATRITPDSSGDSDSLIDTIIHSWYLFDEDEELLPPAFQLVHDLKWKKRSDTYGGWLTLSAGKTPYGPDVLLNPTVNIVGYGAYSIEQILHDDGPQWYAAVRFRLQMKEFIAPMSYIAFDIFGSLNHSGITHRLYEQTTHRYAMDGYEYFERLTVVWERIQVVNIRRIFASISVPLLVPLDNLIVEGGITGGVQYYHVHIDYWYQFLKIKYIPAAGGSYPLALHDKFRNGELNSDHVDPLFFPFAVVVWRPFKPVSIQATISTGIWLIRMGLDIL